jgi:hypothetical protein
MLPEEWIKRGSKRVTILPLCPGPLRVGPPPGKRGRKVLSARWGSIGSEAPGAIGPGQSHKKRPENVHGEVKGILRPYAGPDRKG